ncbi:MAG: alpha/beta fold hydrolase [Candidatus Tectomicrobia bacterium]|uniref:Alpha/beta fold hydrolase n=1 Tax=Tectimicrobiota bacterium TaxID=2528274 RepID=A0A932MNJ8_UNCTE|nr:alpha/beta fold hydrolase [Candidatus Tectomicrobia bacterium]
MPIARVPGGPDIHYEVRGEGPPLLLVSGTGHDHTFWSGQFPLFEPGFRVIVFDNRGVGRSGVPPPGYALADMADDAARVLDAAGAGRAHVMGFSMGGHISQELCLRHPGRVRSLGLHHTWSRNCARLRSFQAARKRLAGRGEREALVEMSLLGLYSHEYWDAHPAEMEKKRKWLIEASPADAGWIGQLEACLAGDTLERLGGIRVPTLITASTHDLIVGTHEAEEIHRRIPGSRLVIMEGTGHVALLERPEAFGRICLGFLREVGDA